MKPEIIPGHSRFGLILWVVTALAVVALFSLTTCAGPRRSVPKKTSALRLLPVTSHQRMTPTLEPAPLRVTPAASASGVLRRDKSAFDLLRRDENAGDRASGTRGSP